MFRTTAYSPEWLTYFNLRPSEDPIELRRAARCTVQLLSPYQLRCRSLSPPSEWAGASADEKKVASLGLVQ
jgi:hypothetical protein